MKRAKKIPLFAIAALLFATFVSACNNQGNQTNLSFCKKCPEYVLANGTVKRYTNPTNINFGPSQEGSQAIFGCNTGFQLSGASNMTCRDGQWIGAIPSCEDIDECDDVDCGGNSTCTNDIGQYICECADGWSGGGVNKTCEKGYCKCTGNQGYYKSDSVVVGKNTYDYGSAYGNTCAKHDKQDYHPEDPKTAWMDEPWCYIPCDPTMCPGINRTRSYYLWRADRENVSMCYSFENCGGTDLFTLDAERCIEQGGQFHTHKHMCHLGIGFGVGKSTCGDGKREDSREECDDGNTDDGDGCSSECLTEQGYLCHGVDDEADKCPHTLTTSAAITVGVLVFVVLATVVGIKCLQIRVKRKKERMSRSLPVEDRKFSKQPLATKLDLKIPPKMPIPLHERTFVDSNYKRFYVESEAPIFQYDLLHSVNTVIKLFASRLNPTRDQDTIKAGVNEFMIKLQEAAFKNNEALQYHVSAVAEYLWSSSKKHQVLDSMELCSVLNAVIRDDLEEEMEGAAITFRSINSLRVNRRSAVNLDDQSYPPDGETWRGGGFRREHRAFFNNIKGKKYRVPGFLSTSNKRSIAAGFAFQASKAHPRAIWRIRFDKRGKEQPQFRVQHMSFVHNSSDPSEQEYLFAPYSVFTLESAEWSGELGVAHEITVRAACDNKVEDERLPLAPWY